MFIEQRLMTRPSYDELSLKFEPAESIFLSPTIKSSWSLDYDDFFQEAEAKYLEINCEIGLARLYVLNLEYRLTHHEYTKDQDETKLL